MDISFIKDYNRFLDQTKIRKGHSQDKKYILTDQKYQHYLLRLSDVSMYLKKEEEFRYLQPLKKLNLPLSLPLEIGKNEQYVYQIFNYIEGEDLEDIIDGFTKEKQYELGKEAGLILFTIHQETSIKHYPFKDYCLQLIEIGKNRPSLSFCVRYLKENLHLLEHRPIVLLHGDYNVENMIYSTDKQVSIIDFNNLLFGDPFYDFKDLLKIKQKYPEFAKGWIDGYFNGEIPNEFYPLLSFYGILSFIEEIQKKKSIGDEIPAYIHKIVKEND